MIFKNINAIVGMFSCLSHAHLRPSEIDAFCCSVLIFTSYTLKDQLLQAFEILLFFSSSADMIAASEDSRRSENMLKEDEAASGDKDDGKDKDIVKLTKAERRQKLKKSKREAKKQLKELDKTGSLQEDSAPENLQSEVLVCHCHGVTFPCLWIHNGFAVLFFFFFRSFFLNVFAYCTASLLFFFL